MNRNIYLIGLNHKTAPVEIRERFALSEHNTAENWGIRCEGAIREALILSTCNRVEIIVCEKECRCTKHDGLSEPTIIGQVLSQWAKCCKRSTEELRPYLYAHKNEQAIRHIFTVASSLDSMVLGEPQILGQLKDAYRKAVENHSAGTILNRLLHKAFSVAKRVRTETAIANSAVSISYAAVELAKRIFGQLHEQKAMLVGAGEMAELAAEHLLQAHISHMYVANRTVERGQELAKKFKGTFIPFEHMVEHLTDVDIIISSTGATEAILTAKDLKGILKKRKYKPMFFIDIAVPRDIDPDVNGLENVYLYDIDDLKEVVEENLAGRKDEAIKAANIIDEELVLFGQWLSSLDVQPTIVDIIQRSENLAHDELQRTLKRLGTNDPKTKAALEDMVSALIRKLNHAPISFLKHGTMSEEGATPRIHMVRRIFDLDDKIPSLRSMKHLKSTEQPIPNKE